MHLPQKFSDFLDHWKALKGESHAPLLADFLDHPIPALQPWLAIFDVGEGLVVRLFGTALVSYYGADFTGKAADTVYASRAHTAMRRFNFAIARSLCGAYAISNGYTSNGRTAEMFTLGLPLRRKDGMSTVWLTQASINLGLRETGEPERSVLSEAWIDLGNGVPR
jgi:hypothetical protein